MSVSVRRFGEAADWSLAHLALAIPVVLVLQLGCSTLGREHPETLTKSPAAAIIDGKVISLTELDQRIGEDLFSLEYGEDASGLHEARRTTIDDMIDEYLLAQAAQAAGQRTDVFLDSALAALPPITDAEVQQLFDENRDKLPAGATLDAYEKNLRGYLDSQRTERLFLALREDTRIDVSIPREHTTVAATGPSLGPVDAPITIVEFSDFQCPYCARAVPIIKALRERHPEEIRIVYRHLPLSFHGQARSAAIAAVCADAQGRFWDYHDVLFDNRKALGREDLIGHAEALGLDRARFETCLADPDTAVIVERDALAAAEAGATGTPTFFVNGIRLTGAQPVERFEAIIDEELERLTD